MTRCLLFGSISSSMGESLELLRERPIHILVNSRAGGGRSLKALPHIKTLLQQQGVAAQFHTPASALELENTARQAISGGATVLLAIGGDGTLQSLVNAAAGADGTLQSLVNAAPGADVTLGILPTGGGNDFAAALNLPKDPIAAAGAILAGTARRVDLARARTADGRERLYCGGGGTGLDAVAVRYAAEVYGSMRGRSRYLLSALRALRDYSALTIRAEFPGSPIEPVERRVLVAAVLNSPSYGAGLTLAPAARIDDGLLDVVLVEELTRMEVAGVVFHWAVRGELRTSRIARWKAPQVRLESDQPCQFQGDGEILGPLPVDIQVLPKALQILAPGRSE